MSSAIVHEVEPGGHQENGSPVVVFGTGGSGTRAIARFLNRCGVTMGKAVNKQFDALFFEDLLNDFIDTVLSATRRLDYDIDSVPLGLSEQIVTQYRLAARRHRGDLEPGRPWGFKNPRNIFLLPFLHTAFPGAILIHVVRDGRDMVLSDNQNQPRKHFAALFGVPFSGSYEDIALFWSRTNLDARAYAERCFGARYVIARIEDLCGTDRETHVGTILTALRLNYAGNLKHANLFGKTESLGRGATLGNQMPSKSSRIFEAARASFGYV